MFDHLNAAPTDSASIDFVAPRLVNDVHSQLNSTLVCDVVAPASIAELQAIIRRASGTGTPLSVAGGRHAMGGQQFGTNTLLIDMSRMNRVLNDGYHAEIDALTSARAKGSEMITEVYVPRDRLEHFMRVMRDDFRRHDVNLIYGTIRLIEADGESFLAWAKKDYACVVFNLHVEHSDDGLAKARADFRRIKDRAVEHDGSFYLTYHHWATREQILACYPQFTEFLRLKRRYDPAKLLRSDWYTHVELIFSEDVLPACA